MASIQPFILLSATVSWEHDYRSESRHWSDSLLDNYNAEERLKWQEPKKVRSVPVPHIGKRFMRTFKGRLFTIGKRK